MVLGSWVILNIRGGSMKSLVLFLFSMSLNSAALANSSRIQFTQKIVGGIDAKKDQVPFIVSLRKYGEHFCGGSLVKENWVLTAAHCIEGGGDPDNILLGSLKSDDSNNAQKFDIAKVIVHPNYNKSTTSGSDFALIKLQKSASIVKAELNKENLETSSTKQFSVAGWGYLSENGYTTSAELQIVDVPYVEQNKCEEQFQAIEKSESPYLDNTMFCAGYDEGKKDACQGDSGGPIFYKDQITQKFVLVGVVSWGYGCARENVSGVYSNIASEVTWINQTIENN